MVGPAIDRSRNRTWWEDTYHCRLRIEGGCLVWGLLSICFLVIGLVQDFPLWSLAFVLGGPLLLLLLVSKLPLANVPVIFVVLACLGGIGWEYAAADYPPWTVGLIFVVYLFSFESALSGMTKLRYLQAIEGMEFTPLRRRRHDEDHLVAKRRIWGYLLATSSSAAIFNGFDSGGQYHLFLLTILVATFLARSRVFGMILSFFETTRSVGAAITARRRWLQILMALVNVAAYGLSLHWLVVYGSAYGAHITLPWSGPAGADGDWFNDLETIAIVIVLWLIAAFRSEWID